jgi:hypothetical protein
MSGIELTVPCVAAHLLAAGVLRFLPTDADTECDQCEGSGFIGRDARMCPRCKVSGRRPLRPGDRIAIRADNDLLHPAILVDHLGGYLYDGADGIDYPLRPGEVVGYATVTNVLPIYRVAHEGAHHKLQACIVAGAHWADYWAEGSTEAVDLSDHLGAGLVFTPGQVALAAEEPPVSAVVPTPSGVSSAGTLDTAVAS